MARSTLARVKDPDSAIATLEGEQSGIEEKRIAVGAALAEARKVLATDGARSAATRQRVALQAAARGRQHELLEVIAKDAADAHAAVASCNAHLQALDGASREIAAEITVIRAENLAYFAADAYRDTLATLETRAKARAAIDEHYQACRRADAKWSHIRSSRRHLGWPDLPRNAVTDLGGMKGTFDTVTAVPPVPGGRLPETEKQIVDVVAASVEFPARWDGA